MPHRTRRSLHHACSLPDNALDRRRYKILHSEFSGHNDPLGGPNEAIAQYLLEEQDFGLCGYILSPFDDVAPSEIQGREGTAKLYTVASALGHLTAFFQALDLGFSGLEPFKHATFSTLSEKWSTVVGWARLLLFHFFKTRDAPRIIGTCVEFLRGMMLTFGSGYGSVEEVFSLRCTIDLVYLLICRVEVYPGEVFAIHSVVSILGCLQFCLNTSSRLGIVTSTSFSLRLCTVSESTRRSIISALVRRAEEFSRPEVLKGQMRLPDHRLDIPKGLESLSACAYYLFEANTSLWKLFMDHEFISAYSSAVEKITKNAALGKPGDEFWSLMASAIVYFITKVLMMQSPNRRYSLAIAIEAGLLSGALTCLLQLEGNADSNIALSLRDRVKELIQCYSPSSRVIKALAKTYPQDMMEDVKNTRNDLHEMQLWVDAAFHRGLAAFEIFGESIDPYMCDNLQCHRIRVEGAGRPVNDDWRAGLKTCGGCRSVTYCSAECQQEDWKGFHKLECPELLRAYNTQKTRRTWESLSIRRDQLTYIEFALNTGRNLSQDWSIQDHVYHLLPSDQGVPKVEDSILVLDFVSYSGIAQVNLPLHEYQSRIWNRIIEVNRYERRFQAMVKEAMGGGQRGRTMPVRGDGGQGCADYREAEVKAGGRKKKLVAGVFFHDMEHATVVLAMVKSGCHGSSDDCCGDGSSEGSAKKEHRCYRIVNSLFCLCSPDTVRNVLWQGRDDFTPVIVPQATDDFSSEVKRSFEQGFENVGK